MSIQLAYSPGDPLPSGCQPYMVIEPTTYIEKWYTTCEKPLSPTSIPTVIQPQADVQQQSLSPHVLHMNSTTQSLPSYLQFSDKQIVSFLTILPWYLIVITIFSFIILTIYFTSRLLLLRKQLKTSHVLLSIKPTNKTLQTAHATEQLFTQIHALISQKTFIELSSTPFSRHSFSIF